MAALTLQEGGETDLTSGHSYSRVHRALETSGILGMAFFSAGLAWRISSNAKGRAAGLVVAASAVLGYLLADFVSGFVHWLADRFGTVKTPLLGKIFVRPFREHHLDPEAIARHDFIETNGNNCLVSLPPVALTFFFLPASPGQLLRLFILGMVLFLCFSVFATNQFHKWAHMTEPPAVPRILQRAHLILTRNHHAIHHLSPFNTHYCITTGWFNWPLAKLRFFGTLERILRPAASSLNPVEARPVSK